MRDVFIIDNSIFEDALTEDGKEEFRESSKQFIDQLFRLKLDEINAGYIPIYTVRIASFVRLLTNVYIEISTIVFIRYTTNERGENKMGISQNVDDTTKVFTAILALGLTGLLFLIIFGNLSGNLGFAPGSQGETDTNQVIGNLTGGAVQFFSFSNVWFILLAVTLLIIIVVSVIGLVSKKGSSGFSS